MGVVTSTLPRPYQGEGRGEREWSWNPRLVLMESRGEDAPVGRAVIEQETLRGYARAQALSLEAALEVADQLRPGVTEAETAQLLDQKARSLGARGQFHRTLVWFGEHTRFQGQSSRIGAFPGDTALESGAAVILDHAPLFDGYPGDVSHSRNAGEGDHGTGATAHLAALRAAIPPMVAQGMTSMEIALAVRQLTEAAGMRSLQNRYLFHALGHRVESVRFPGLSTIRLAGLGLPSAARLFGPAILHGVPGIQAEWPIWSESPRANIRPGHGLWSIEPHIECEGRGVKWEELLLIDDEGARWLEADSPLPR